MRIIKTPATQIEIFHLLFLQQFSHQISPHLYAIKGGCNLRFFFHSVRYSEDLDMDVVTIQKQTLENKVNKILQSSLLMKLLQEYGIHHITTTAPKQTLTTQRWKIQLYSQSDMPLNTKIEFSRRTGKQRAELGAVVMSICRQYRLPPMQLSHYGLQEAVLQKIMALANRSATQARDIFDLYYLVHLVTEPISIEKKIIEKAKEAMFTLNFKDYQSQVVNFLEPEKQTELGGKNNWDIISNTVYDFLNTL